MDCITHFKAISHYWISRGTYMHKVVIENNIKTWLTTVFFFLFEHFYTLPILELQFFGKRWTVFQFNATCTLKRRSEDSRDHLNAPKNGFHKSTNWLITIKAWNILISILNFCLLIYKYTDSDFSIEISTFCQKVVFC